MTNNTIESIDRQDLLSVNQLNNLWSTYHAGIAESFGVNESVFISYLWSRIKKNNQNGINNIFGRTWFSCSIREISKRISFYTEEQIKLIIKKCIQSGLIVSERLSINKYDKTNYYALTPVGLQMCRQADNALKQNSNESLQQRIEELEEQNATLKQNIIRLSRPISFWGKVRKCVNDLIGGVSHD